MIYFDRYYDYVIRGNACRWHSQYKGAQIFRAYDMRTLRPRMLYFAWISADGKRGYILEDVNLSGIKKAVGQFCNGVQVTGTSADVWTDQHANEDIYTRGVNTDVQQ